MSGVYIDLVPVRMAIDQLNGQNFTRQQLDGIMRDIDGEVVKIKHDVEDQFERLRATGQLTLESEERLKVQVQMLRDELFASREETNNLHQKLASVVHHVEAGERHLQSARQIIEE